MIILEPKTFSTMAQNIHFFPTKNVKIIEIPRSKSALKILKLIVQILLKKNFSLNLGSRTSTDFFSENFFFNVFRNHDTRHESWHNILYIIFDKYYIFMEKILKYVLPKHSDKQKRTEACVRTPYFLFIFLRFFWWSFFIDIS